MSVELEKLTKEEKEELFKSLQSEFGKTEENTTTKEDLIKAMTELESENEKLSGEVESLRKSLEEGADEEGAVMIDFDNVVESIDNRNNQIDLIAKGQAVTMDVVVNLTKKIEEYKDSLAEIKKALNMPVATPKSVVSMSDVDDKDENNKALAKSEAINRLSVAFEKTESDVVKSQIRELLLKVDHEAITSDELKRVGA